MSANPNGNSQGQLCLISARESIGPEGVAPPVNKVELLKYLANTLSLEIEALPESPLVDVKRGINFYEEVRRYEVMLIKTALTQTQGNQKEAARLLGLNPSTINAIIKRNEIS
jgi:transcriptional regulator with GAF, ATPase, and Fis domain